MRVTRCECTWCSIVPPYVFDELQRKSTDPAVRQYIEETRRADAAFRSARAAVLGSSLMTALAPGDQPLKRVVYDCEKSNDLARKRVLEEGGNLPTDNTVREGYEGAGTTWKFYKDIFARSSVDNSGLTLVSSVHYRL